MSVRRTSTERSQQRRWVLRFVLMSCLALGCSTAAEEGLSLAEGGALPETAVASTTASQPTTTSAGTDDLSQEADMPDETLTDANDLEAETETGAEAGNEVAVEAEAPKADEGPNCRRLMDFNVANENEQWFVVNDNVMGGRSDGGISFTDDTMVFAGNINTDGGGFSSIRLPLDATALENSARFVMRAKSDGRDYKLTSADALEGRDRRENHQAPLSFVQAGVWEEVVVPFDSLEPVLFGRRIEAAPFRPDLVTRIGVMMSDGIDGAFSLEIDWIDICE